MHFPFRFTCVFKSGEYPPKTVTIQLWLSRVLRKKEEGSRRSKPVRTRKVNKFSFLSQNLLFVFFFFLFVHVPLNVEQTTKSLQNQEHSTNIGDKNTRVVELFTHMNKTKASFLRSVTNRIRSIFQVYVFLPKIKITG